MIFLVNKADQLVAAVLSHLTATLGEGVSVCMTAALIQPSVSVCCLVTSPPPWHHGMPGLDIISDTVMSDVIQSVLLF